MVIIMNEEMILHAVSSDGLLPQKDSTKILFIHSGWCLGHYISLATDSFFFSPPYGVGVYFLTGDHSFPSALSHVLFKSLVRGACPERSARA